MADNNPDTNNPVKQLTAAQAAKCVQRTVTELVDGKVNGKPAKVAQAKKIPVTEDEVLSFKDYGSYVVVVTIDGQKLTGAIKAE